MTESPQPPRPPTKPPRSALGMRDMIGALLVLAVIVFAVAALSRGCSFSPGGPSVEPGAGPTVDAGSELRALAPNVPFPVRVPRVPADWRANSVDLVGVGDGQAVRVGYVTGSGRFLRLVQSDAPEEALLAEENAGEPAPVAVGPVDVAGRTWVRYRGAREQIWVARGDEGARWLVTGSGDEAGFRTLTAAVSSGEKLGG